VESTRISPFSFRSSDIGVVLDMMIHDLDLVLHLVGSKVARVDAIGVPVLGSHEDIANARITFEDGCVANVTASRVAMKKERKIRLFAPDCYASLDFAERKGRLYRLNPERKKLAGDLDRVDPKAFENPLAFVFGNLIQVEEIAMDDHEPLRLELESFVAAARSGDKPVVSGEDALAALELADRILDGIGSFRERSRSFID
jgi:predicted dehydrogenase